MRGSFWDVVVGDPSTPTPPDPATDESRGSSYRTASATQSPATSYSSSTGPISPVNTHRTRTYDSYDSQSYQHAGPPRLSPSNIVPASPQTSAAEYGRSLPYPNPANLAHSYSSFHPSVFDQGPSIPANANEVVYPVYRPRYIEDYAQDYARVEEPMRRRERAPSPEEESPYHLRREEQTFDPRIKSEAEGPSPDEFVDFFEFVAGRQVPRRPCVYGLPIDEEERTRLDIGHQMILLAQPGLFLGNVAELLDPETSKGPKRILDIGTGNGSWAAAVAGKHPKAAIDAIDLVPNGRALPHNVFFYRQDVNRGLAKPQEEYDLVHARNIQLGIPDYPKLIDECARVLKTRGLINLIEGDWDIFDSDGNPVTLYKNPGWFNWIQAWRGAVMQKNIDLQAPQKTEQWLKDSPYFTEVKTTARWMPVGPWTNDGDMNQLGEVVWENLKYLIPSIRPLLTEYYRGDQYMADIIVQHAWAELASPHSHVFMRWRFFWAKRNKTRWSADGPVTRKSRKGKERERPAPYNEPGSLRA